MSHPIDELDRQIIRALQENGRQSNVDLARETGVTEATIRKRLERLIDQQIIHVAAFANLAHVGMGTGALIALQVDLTHIGQIAGQLAHLPQVRSVCHTTGEYDLFAEVVFSSDQDLLRFLTSDIAGIPGIRKTSTFHVLKRIKEEYQWMLPAPAPPGILIVDDDPDFVQATRIVLERAGFEVMSAANGDEALAVLDHCRPALVIMDIMMKGILDGLHASWQIQANPELRNLPILMISSIADSHYAEMFPTDENIPADNFLSKPVSPDRLIQEVNRLLQKRAR